MKKKEKCAACQRVIPKKDRELNRYWQSNFTDDYYCCREDCPSVYQRLKKKRERVKEEECPTST